MEECTTLRRVTYKEGPHVRANGGTKPNAPWDLDKGPQIRLLEEVKDELLPASRPDALRRGVPPTPPDHLPYMHLAGTDPEDYKRGLPPCDTSGV